MIPTSGRKGEGTAARSKRRKKKEAKPARFFAKRISAVTYRACFPSSVELIRRVVLLPFRFPTAPRIGIVGRCHSFQLGYSVQKSTTGTRVDFCHRLYVAKEKASRCVANGLQVARIVWNEDVDSSGSGRNRKRLDVANRAGRTGKTGGASVSRSSIEIDSPVVFSLQEAFRSPDEPTFHRAATLSSIRTLERSGYTVLSMLLPLRLTRCAIGTTRAASTFVTYLISADRLPPIAATRPRLRDLPYRLRRYKTFDLVPIEI